jgi:hypothetical protein
MPTMPTVAQAMYPTLRSNSPEALAKERADAKERALREEDRQRLVRLLRETRETMRADRERGR